MTIKLQGSSSGHVNLDAKATAANNTITLPDTASGELVAADSSGHINLADSKMIKLGTGGDLTITHDGSDAKISNDTGAFVIQDSHAGANAVIIRKGGEVELLHNNVLACETSANGLAFPNGKGIDFSATPNSGGANHGEILTDYESGTFTPTYANGTVTYSAQYGYYIRVGNLVHVWFDMTIASCSGQTGVPWLAGFPFNKIAHNSQNYYEGITWWFLNDNFVNSKPIANGYMANNDATINMYYGDTNYLHGGGGGGSWVVNQTGRIAGCFNYTAG